MAPTSQRIAAEGPLLLADISGYTSFLQDVEVAHRDDAFANGAIPEAYGLILHAGRYVLQEIAGSRELSGPDVVMAHRLLKNRAAEIVGGGAYLLVSAAAVTTLDIPVGDATAMSETYEHYQPIDTFAIPLATAAGTVSASG